MLDVLKELFEIFMSAIIDALITPAEQLDEKKKRRRKIILRTITIVAVASIIILPILNGYGII